MSRGGQANAGWVAGSAHAGTHVDAPYHVREDGPRIGGLDLDAFVGPCHVIDARWRAALDVDLFDRLDIATAPRVLIRTQAAPMSDPYGSAFPTLTPRAADALCRAGVRLLGIDAPSFDPLDSPDLPIHRALARAGIPNVENLVLDRVSPGEYEFLGAPVRWAEMDAAPLRALLRR